MLLPDFIPPALTESCPGCGFSKAGTTEDCHECAVRASRVLRLVGWLADNATVLRPEQVRAEAVRALAAQDRTAVAR
jgi:hypothetical protein